MGLWIKNADGTIERTAGGGTDGEDGQPGADGTDGADGLPGADGNLWHVGSGEPDPTLGEPGDYYLDGEDGWVYVKRSNSAWTNLYVNLTGPPGDVGDYLPLTGGALTGDLNINHAGKQAEPSLSFNTGANGIMGFYSAYNDRLRVTVGGIAQTDFHDGLFETLYNARVRGDLQVDGEASVGNGKTLRFNGNWGTVRIYNTSAAGRQYMVIGQSGDGAAINLYGDSDSNGPGNVLFYAGSQTVGRWDGVTGKFIAYRDAEIRGDLTLNGKLNGQAVFGVAAGIDTRDVLDRAETATMPAFDDEGVATADAESITVNEVVTALLAKVKDLSARIETLEGQKRPIR